MMLEAERLDFAYPRGPTVVSDLSLGLDAGALLAIVGPNGSGKSTLLKLLAGILVPRSGSVLWEGAPLGRLPRIELARCISYVPQQSNVGLAFTAGEIVALGRHPYQRGLGFESAADVAAVRDALVLTEAVELAHRPFRDLSGGERQRVLLARAIAQDAKLLLLDEPTAALDLKHEARVWQILRRLASEGRAVVGVTHDLNLASLYSPCLLMLKAGRRVAMGAPQEILRQDLIESVYETAVHVDSRSAGAPFVLPARPETSGGPSGEGGGGVA